MLLNKRNLVFIVSLFGSFNLYAQDYAIQEIEPNKEEVQSQTQSLNLETQTQSLNSETQNFENKKESVSDKVTQDKQEPVTSANGNGEQNQNMNEQFHLQNNDTNSNANNK